MPALGLFFSYSAVDDNRRRAVWRLSRLGTWRCPLTGSVITTRWTSDSNGPLGTSLGRNENGAATNRWDVAAAGKKMLAVLFDLSLAAQFGLALAFLLAVFKLYLMATLGVCTSKNRLDGKTVVVTGANTGIGTSTTSLSNQ